MRSLLSPQHPSPATAHFCTLARGAEGAAASVSLAWRWPQAQLLCPGRPLSKHGTVRSGVGRRAWLVWDITARGARLKEYVQPR